jgi:hypothetical protein
VAWLAVYRVDFRVPTATKDTRGGFRVSKQVENRYFCHFWVKMRVFFEEKTLFFFEKTTFFLKKHFFFEKSTIFWEKNKFLGQNEVFLSFFGKLESGNGKIKIKSNLLKNIRWAGWLEFQRQNECKKWKHNQQTQQKSFISICSCLKSCREAGTRMYR